jgi:hypothetical protein
MIRCPICGTVANAGVDPCARCGTQLIPVVPPISTAGSPPVGPPLQEMPLRDDRPRAPVPPHGRRRTVLVITIAVLFVAVTAIAVAGATSGSNNEAAPADVTSSSLQPGGIPPSSATPTTPVTISSAPTSNPSTTTTARAQAIAIEHVLERSDQAHNSIGTAISGVDNCNQLGSDYSILENADTIRDNLASEMTPQSASLLPNGAQLVAVLRQALTASSEADASYAAWAQVEEGGCTTGDTGQPDFMAAARYDGSAGSVKATVAHLWNPIAARYRLYVLKIDSNGAWNF